MANLNFPSTTGQPTDGSFQYTDANNGVIYSWDGTKWEANTGSSLNSMYVQVAGDTMTGDLTVPNLISEGDVQTTSLNGGPLAGFRNQIINGDFRIWQRGTSVTRTDPGYTADRWFVNDITGTDTTVSRSDDAPEGLAYSLEKEANINGLKYGIELDKPNCNCQFKIGSIWTLSLWATNAPSAGIIRFRQGVVVSSGSINACAGVNFTSTGETSNGFTRYAATLTITGDASSSSSGLKTAEVSISDTSQVNKFAGIQLEPGPVATPFEHRPYETELALCQRYYYTTGSIRITPTKLCTSNTNDSTSEAQFQFPQTMRVAPTHNLVSSSVVNGNFTSSSVTDSWARIKVTPLVSGTAYVLEDRTFDAEL